MYPEEDKGIKKVDEFLRRIGPTDLRFIFARDVEKVIGIIEELEKKYADYMRDIRESVSDSAVLKLMNEVYQNVVEKLEQARLFISKEEFAGLRYGEEGFVSIQKEIDHLQKEELSELSKAAQCELSIIQFLTNIENLGLIALDEKAYSSSQEALHFLNQSKEKHSACMRKIGALVNRNEDLKIMHDVYKHVTDEIEQEISLISNGKSVSKKKMRDLGVRLTSISTKAKDKLCVTRFLVDIQRSIIAFEKTGEHMFDDEFKGFIEELASICDRYQSKKEEIANPELSAIFDTVYNDIKKGIKSIDSSVKWLDSRGVEHSGFIVDEIKNSNDFKSKVLSIVEKAFDNIEKAALTEPMVKKSASKKVKKESLTTSTSAEKVPSKSSPIMKDIQNVLDDGKVRIGKRTEKAKKQLKVVLQKVTFSEDRKKLNKYFSKKIEKVKKSTEDPFVKAEEDLFIFKAHLQSPDRVVRHRDLLDPPGFFVGTIEKLENLFESVSKAKAHLGETKANMGQAFDYAKESFKQLHNSDDKELKKVFSEANMIIKNFFEASKDILKECKKRIQSIDNKVDSPSSDLTGVNSAEVVVDDNIVKKK